MPGFLASTLPDLVTFRRFEYDLFVFFMMSVLCGFFFLRSSPFDNDGETLRAFLRRFGNFVLFGQQSENAREPLFEKFRLHVLGASREKEVELHAVPFFEPC